MQDEKNDPKTTDDDAAKVSPVKETDKPQQEKTANEKLHEYDQPERKFR